MNATADTLLYLDGVSVSFDGFRALNALSLYIQKGEMRAVIGPNGAGKTTLLNMVSGFYHPSEGTIQLGGRDLAGRPAHVVARAGIARTYQTTRLFGSLPVIDNADWRLIRLLLERMPPARLHRVGALLDGIDGRG